MITRIIASILIVLGLTLYGNSIINKCVHIIEKTPVQQKTMKIIILTIITLLIAAIIVLIGSALLMG